MTLRVDRTMFTRDARLIRRMALEIVRQTEVYERNAPAGEAEALRFITMNIDAHKLWKATQRAARRYEEGYRQRDAADAQQAERL